MGACYSSKTGQDALRTAKDNEPYAKVRTVDSHKNGHSSHIEYCPVPVGDDAVTKTAEEEVSKDAEYDKHQEESQDLLVKDANKNIQTLTCLSTRVGSDTRPSETVQVVASDSGIVVDSDVAVGNSDVAVFSDCTKDLSSVTSTSTGARSEAIPIDRPKHVRPLELKLQSCSCPSAERTYPSSLESQTVQSRHSHSYGHGECTDQLFYSSSTGSSESLILKSSLKKGKSRLGKKHRLSWKSADSLDWVPSMSFCLDRTKSEASDIFGDDISLNAPLATFDSVDFALGSSYDFSKQFRNSCIEYCSDTFQFKFDFSGLEGEVPSSVDKKCDTPDKDPSVTDLDKIKFAIRSSVSSPTDHRAFFEPDTSYELPSSVGQQPEVTTMNLNGREVVVIDQELFSQILDEIQFLKMKLSQLTEVIQEDQEHKLDVSGDSLPH